ncbi:MAG: hypothetical protein WB786_04870 [Thermoplasmata archaeon]
MVFVRDEGSVYNAPVDEVWRFLSTDAAHSEAHRHRKVERKTLPGNAGEYTWEQDFEGKPEQFIMRWTSFPPFGIAYDVLGGPFTGSKFFVYYRPRGDKTRVTIVGDFVSPTLSATRIEASVLGFFALEFEQDSAAITAMLATK